MATAWQAALLQMPTWDILENAPWRQGGLSSGRKGACAMLLLYLGDLSREARLTSLSDVVSFVRFEGREFGSRKWPMPTAAFWCTLIEFF